MYTHQTLQDGFKKKKKKKEKQHETYCVYQQFKKKGFTLDFWPRNH